MARAGWFLWEKFRRRSRTRPPHRTHNCMGRAALSGVAPSKVYAGTAVRVVPFSMLCGRSSATPVTLTPQPARLTASAQTSASAASFWGDGFHGETSFRIFTKSVSPAHGNCKRFRTKPRFRSTKWSVRIKKCQEQAVLLAGKIFGCDGGHRGRACRGEHCSPAEPRCGNPFTGKHRHIRPSSGPAGPPSPSGEGRKILPQQIRHAL